MAAFAQEVALSAHRSGPARREGVLTMCPMVGRYGTQGGLMEPRLQLCDGVGRQSGLHSGWYPG
jgi:hypothetical protein